MNGRSNGSSSVRDDEGPTRFLSDRRLRNLDGHIGRERFKIDGPDPQVMSRGGSGSLHLKISSASYPYPVIPSKIKQVLQEGEEPGDRLLELEGMRMYLMSACAAVDATVASMSTAKDRWVLHAPGFNELIAQHTSIAASGSPSS